MTCTKQKYEIPIAPRYGRLSKHRFSELKILMTGKSFGKFKLLATFELTSRGNL